MIPVIKIIFLMETLLLAKKLSENKLIKRPKRDVYIQSTEAGKIVWQLHKCLYLQVFK